MSQRQTFADRRFLKNSEIPEELLKLAHKIEDREKRLFDLIRADDLNEAVQSALAESITASYEIENEYLDSETVKSFVISSMAMKTEDWIETEWIGQDNDDTDFIPAEKLAVQGIMACLNTDPLDHDMIFRVNGLSCGEVVSAYRNHPEVVRTRMRIIYEAPDPEIVPQLMDGFVKWWNDERTGLPSSIGAAIAHYNFVAIHPFRDGNGRTARALAEKALITSKETIFRPYSLSAQILREKLDYYGALRTGDPLVFTRYILLMHELAIDKGMEEARRLGFVRLFLKRDKFSCDERTIITKMSIRPDFKWQAEDFYLARNAEAAFSKLQKKGVITKEGKFNLAYRPSQNQKM